MTEILSAVSPCVQLEYVGSYVFSSISAAMPREGSLMTNPMPNISSTGASGCSVRFRHGNLETDISNQ